MSLHRSEGFGRNIAESMMLRKPVIVTGHSGNMDFTTPGTAALVDHRLTLVKKGEYPFGDGMPWAEPDIETPHGGCGGCSKTSSCVKILRARGGNSPYRLIRLP